MAKSRLNEYRVVTALLEFYDKDSFSFLQVMDKVDINQHTAYTILSKLKEHLKEEPTRKRIGRKRYTTSPLGYMRLTQLKILLYEYLTEEEKRVVKK